MWSKDDYELEPGTNALLIGVTFLSCGPPWVHVGANHKVRGWVDILGYLMPPQDKANATYWEGQFRAHLRKDEIFEWSLSNLVDLVSCKLKFCTMSDGTYVQPGNGVATTITLNAVPTVPLIKVPDSAYEVPDWAKDPNLKSQELCPTCGPNRGTMLYTTESNCWRCGWVRMDHGHA